MTQCENADKAGADDVFRLLLAAGVADPSLPSSSPSAPAGGSGDSSVDAPFVKCPTPDIRARLAAILSAFQSDAWRLDAVPIVALPPVVGATKAATAAAANAVAVSSAAAAPAAAASSSSRPPAPALTASSTANTGSSAQLPNDDTLLAWQRAQAEKSAFQAEMARARMMAGGGGAGGAGSLASSGGSAMKNDPKALLRAEQMFAKLRAVAERVEALAAAWEVAQSKTQQQKQQQQSRGQSIDDDDDDDEAEADGRELVSEETKFIQLLGEAEPLLEAGELFALVFDFLSTELFSFSMFH